MAPPNGVSNTAMILAAGLGTRMRPLSDARPKCLLELGGRAIIDYVLDHLEAVGVERVIVNLNYKGEMVRRHLAGREGPEIEFSDEASEILDSGGGVKQVVREFGRAPFFVVNGISLWFDDGASALGRLADAYQPETMDALLLLQRVTGAIGYDGAGDFVMAGDNRLYRRPVDAQAPYVFMGAQLLHPDLFEDSPDAPFSLNLLYDRAEAADRLFGLEHRGRWMNLKTPEAFDVAKRALVD